MFLDEVRISIAAGKGGNGCVGFRREAHVPKGGPDGGNGGDGGNVIIRADANKNTLYHFRGVKRFAAQNGQPGSGQLKSGKHGDDLVLDVPVGTMIFQDGEQIADLNRHGASLLAGRGGLGGKGNAGFKASTRQTPRFAELGEPGEEKELHLELSLVADIGIIGLPSVGKSTLISCISAARPAIADYPFTTITPNLGVVSHRGEQFVATDLPGLIKGASRGKGLGHQFLKHAERVRIFVHLVSADSASPVTDYRTIRNELRKWQPEMLDKPEVIALSKADLLEPEARDKLVEKIRKAAPDAQILPLSAPIHEGLTELLDAVLQALHTLPAEAEPLPELPTYRPHLSQKSRSFHARRQNKQLYMLDGPRLNQIAIMTDFNNYEALARMHDVLKKFGAEKEIIKLGAEPGCKLEIAGKRFEWWG